jgi:archaellum component FlaF (FlaF/FlaG flagellin family)
MYTQEVEKKKSTIFQYMTLVISTTLPFIVVIEDYALYATIILLSASVAFAILYFSTIRVEVRTDGIYRNYNLSPMTKKIISKDDIVNTEVKSDENAQKSNQYSFGDTVISMDVEGAVHIDSDEDKVVISSENPEELANAVKEIES